MAKYLKRDSDLGYIEDSAKIEYLKLNNLRHTILGCMLGDFDEQGFYVVSAEIQKELLSMKKFLVKTIDNIEICRGEIMLNKPITFMVTFEADRATLSLVERLSFEANLEIDSGTYSNVNEFILDEVETAGEVDRNKIYKMWNINPMGGDILDISKMDEETLALYFGIVNRYKYLLYANQLMLEKESELEEIEAEYSLGMLEVLNHYPKLKALVDAEIKTDLKDKKEFIRIDKPNFAKTFNEVLDQAIEGNLNVLSEEELSAFNQESKAVLQARNIKMQEKLDIKTQPALEEESNQTELDEEFAADRTFNKITLNTNGQENGKSIPELEQEFAEKERKVTDDLADRAVGIAGVIFGAAAGVVVGAVSGVVSGVASAVTRLIQKVNGDYAPNGLIGRKIGEKNANNQTQPNLAPSTTQSNGTTANNSTGRGRNNSTNNTISPRKKPAAQQGPKQDKNKQQQNRTNPNYSSSSSGSSTNTNRNSNQAQSNATNDRYTPYGRANNGQSRNINNRQGRNTAADRKQQEFEQILRSMRERNRGVNVESREGVQVNSRDMGI